MRKTKIVCTIGPACESEGITNGGSGNTNLIKLENL